MHAVVQASVAQLFMHVTISEQLVPDWFVPVDVPPVLPMTGCVGFGPPSAPTELADPMLLNTFPTVVPSRLLLSFEQLLATMPVS